MTVFRYYRIKSLIDGKTYIGKTKRTLEQRLQRHRDDLKKYLKKTRHSRNCGSYQLIQDKVEGVDYIIELLFELDVEQEPTERVIEQIFINSEKAVVTSSTHILVLTKLNKKIMKGLKSIARAIPTIIKIGIKQTKKRIMKKGNNGIKQTKRD